MPEFPAWAWLVLTRCEDVDKIKRMVEFFPCPLRSHFAFSDSSDGAKEMPPPPRRVSSVPPVESLSTGFLHSLPDVLKGISTWCGFGPQGTIAMPGDISGCPDHRGLLASGW